MLAVNLIASKLLGAADSEHLASYVWNLNVLFAFFIWSLAYSILLLMHKDDVWAKTIHLIFAVCSLGSLILLKSVFSPTAGPMVFLHGVAATLLVYQVLLTYATLRSFAGPKKEIPEEPDAFSVRPEREETGGKWCHLGLPPSALKMTLFLFIVLPILTDLHHRFEIASSSAKMMSEMANHEKSLSELMTVTPISVHAGPAIGDEVVGVLPKGTRVPIVIKKYGWVNIGENKWVAEKFLRPINRDQSGKFITMRGK
jgi:hypothetical protein